MKKRIIKLINNEHLGRKVASAKACISNSVDICEKVDAFHCTVYAYDYCGKDYAACTEGADDICEVRDVTACSGAGQLDYT